MPSHYEYYLKSGVNDGRPLADKLPPTLFRDQYADCVDDYEVVIPTVVLHGGQVVSSLYETPRATYCYVLHGPQTSQGLQWKVREGECDFEHAIVDTLGLDMNSVVVKPKPNIPAGGAPTISGAARVGETLTASKTGIADVDGMSGAVFSYQWLANGADIAVATSDTHTLVEADVGKTIKVRVGFNDNDDNEESLTSEATAAVTPAIRGEIIYSARLTVGTGTESDGTTLLGFNSGQTVGDIQPRTFTHEGVDHELVTFYLSTSSGGSTSLSINMEGTRLDSDEFGLILDGAALSTGTRGELNAGYVQFTNSNPGLTWTDGQTVEVQVVKNSPATGAPAISGDDPPQVGEPLAAGRGTIADDNGVPAAHTFSYQWIVVDGGTETDITDATGATYRPVTDDLGKTIKVRASFVDLNKVTESRTSAATAAVVGSNYTVQCAFTYEYHLKSGVNDGRPLAGKLPPTLFRDQYADCVDDYEVVIPTVVLHGGQVVSSLYENPRATFCYVRHGSQTLQRLQWNVREGECDFEHAIVDTLGLDMNSVVVKPKPNIPAGGTPSISGTAQMGETLMADTTGIADVDGMSGAVFSYQWLTNGAHIAGATSDTYTLVETDVGKAIRVRVSFDDDRNFLETLTSEATATVVTPLTAEFQDVPDKHDGTAFTFLIAFSEPISIGYATLRDDFLDVTNGAATNAKRVDGQSDLWQITVEPDSDAAVTVVLPITEDCGTQRAVCFRAGGNERRPLSNRSELTVPGPAAANSPAMGAPSISGTAQVGETLTVDTSGIDDADGMSGAVFSYQWLANEVNIDTEITGATDPTYTLVEADVGKAVKVRVTFNDDDYNEETLTSEATAAVAAETEVPDAPQSLNVSLDDTGTLGVSWEAPASDGGSAITRLQGAVEVRLRGLRRKRRFNPAGGDHRPGKPDPHHHRTDRRRGIRGQGHRRQRHRRRAAVGRGDGNAQGDHPRRSFRSLRCMAQP